MSDAKCQKQGEHPMFTVETDLQETDRVCQLDPQTTGVKEITVTNYKGYPVYVDLHIESLNDRLEFLDVGDTTFHVGRKVLPPAEIGNPTQQAFRLRVSQFSDPNEQEESLRVQLTYYDREDVPDEAKNDSIPEVFPEVDLA